TSEREEGNGEIRRQPAMDEGARDEGRSRRARLGEERETERDEDRRARREEIGWSERVRDAGEKEQCEDRRRSDGVLIDQRSRRERPEGGETAPQGPEQRSEDEAHGGRADPEKR